MALKVWPTDLVIWHFQAVPFQSNAPNILHDCFTDMSIQTHICQSNTIQTDSLAHLHVRPETCIVGMCKSQCRRHSTFKFYLFFLPDVLFHSSQNLLLGCIKMFPASTSLFVGIVIPFWDYLKTEARQKLRG